MANQFCPLGSIEPHSNYLKLPPKNTLLYKVMKVEDFINSILGNYLYFNRVDSYKDFIKADPYDSEQLPLDRVGNASSYFEKDPSFTLERSYDQARQRTYALCLSLENSKYIWTHYGLNGKKGKICLVFDFEKLKESINQNLSSEDAHLQYKNQRCYQIFDINYGLIEYIDKRTFQINTTYLANPIQYVYLKDHRFKQEKELRISLSPVGTGYKLHNGDIIKFPPYLTMKFDFSRAIQNQIITKILTRNGELNCSSIAEIFQINF